LIRETFKEIRKELVQSLHYDDDQKSSHWMIHTEGAEITNDAKIGGINGFSNRSPRFPFSYSLHRRAQKRIFDNFDRAVGSVFYDLALQFCSVQSRSLDVCVIRHVYTFMYLERFGLLGKDKIACVIGDGQANFVSLALKADSFKKVISINLTEVLLSDLDMVERLGLEKGELGLAKTQLELLTMLSQPNIRLVMIRAADAGVIRDAGIDLFVNIVSFQEMNTELVGRYFDLIKSNSSWLYCCNREHKELYGGEILEFYSYPWEGSVIELDEICPWHEYFYDFKSVSLFRRLKYDGAIRHRIVKF